MMTETAKKMRDIVTGYKGRKLRIMEVCGTHTHEIFRLGIRKLLPKDIQLISGPGCPVCVTPTSYIDEAIYLAEQGMTICTFGDLVRVPGTTSSLRDTRTKGAKIQVVYTPLDAVTYAKEHSEEEVVFLSVGFETTTPASILSVKHAIAKKLTNYALLTANKTMDEAYKAMKDSADAYLYPGHVCAITGTALPSALTKKGVSGVVAGFTAEELLTAIAAIVIKSQEEAPFFKNCYTRVVREAGNPPARKLVHAFMEPCDAEWRGIGVLKNSGMQLREAFAPFDARKKFSIPAVEGRPNPACRCGDILCGDAAPPDCPLYKKICTPEHPVGACMVSSEGTCSAFYRYGGEF